EFAETEIELRNDLIFIETLGNILMVAIRNRQFFQEKMAQESLRRELEVAETIQKQLLISDFTHFKDIDVYGLNLSHQRVGGDFYDVIQKENGSIFLCIADVSGKGIGAALLMSNLQANLRALCARYSELPVIVGELNNILHSITEGDKFVTLFLARIDLPTRTFTYVNAGHNYPLFLTGGEALRLEVGCMLLGILPDLHIQQDTLPYLPGDLLFTFTDGVVEQGDPTDELFGSERLAEELFRVRHAPAREVVNQVERTLYAFAREVGPSDDITMLAVKFLSES
ncbi:MAG: serine/threonine-protein phosphatase, partial [Bacteroidetes bacterium]